MVDNKLRKCMNTPWSLTSFPHPLLLDFKTKWQKEWSQLLWATDKACTKTKRTPAMDGTITSNLQRAQKQLHKVCCQAATLWQEFLESLLQTANLIGNKKKKKLILQLRLAEMNWKCFAQVQLILKPKSPGRLMHLLIPDDTPNRWQMVDDRTKMETHLLQHCQKHFSNAQGSPYMIPPLSTLL